MANGSKTASPFSIVVQEGFAFGQFKLNETLTETTSVGRFLQHHAIENADSNSVKAAIKKASLPSIVEAANVEIGDDDDEMMVRLTAIYKSKIAVDTSNVPSVETIRAKTETTSALAFGDMVDKAMIDYLDSSIEAIRTGKAMPVGLMQHMRRLFDNAKTKSGLAFWDECPPRGTVYIPGKPSRNKAPLGYRTPDDTKKEHQNLPVFHGPYNIFVTQSGDEQDWTKNFVGRKIAPTMAARIKHIQAAIAGAPLETEAKMFPDIKAMRERQSSLELNEALADASFEWNSRVRAVDDAIALCQGARAMEAEWDNLTVELAGKQLLPAKTDAQCERMLKPFVFVTTTDVVEKDKKTGKEVTVRKPNVGPAYGAATVRNAIRRMHELKNAPAFKGKLSLATFVEKKKKDDKANDKNKQQAKTTPGADHGAKLETIDQFKLVCSVQYDYLKSADKTNMILKLARDPNNGPEFCSLLVSIRDVFVEVCNAEGITEKALLWDNLQQQADAVNAKAQLQKQEKEKVASK